MGMYDYINGEQVKCFYIPFYYNSTKETNDCHINHSGGHLYSFANGNEVPLQTNYYKYDKNLIILDTLFREKTYYCPSCHNEGHEDELKDGKLICDLCETNMKPSPAIIHIIRDGKIFKTIYDVYDEMNEELFGNTKMVIDYYGNKINITSYQDILSYLPDYRNYKEIVYECAKKTTPILNQMGKMLRDKKNGIFDKKEFENLEFMYECERANADSKIEEAQNLYMDKWKANQNDIELCFGEYIDIIENVENSPYEELKSNIPLIIEEFKTFLTCNPNAYSLYKKYFEINIDKDKEILNLLKKYNIKI